jgi:hypothetical protein
VRWLGVLIAVLVIIWKGKELKDVIMEKVSDGIIPETPESLAAAAGASVDVYSLARMMQSEESTIEARAAVGWAVRNHARVAKLTVTQLLTRARHKDKSTGKITVYDSDGHYGTQRCTPGRFASTFREPTNATLTLAEEVMSGRRPDPTGGADQFDAPDLQDRMAEKDPTGKTKNAAQVAAARIAAGKELVLVEDVPNTRFWRKA